MNSSEPRDPLSNALQEWRVQPAANPHFRPAVWETIRVRARESWLGYVRAHRLALTVAMIAVVSVAGWTGQAAARAKMVADRDAMVVAYLVELDPRVQAKLRP